MAVRNDLSVDFIASPRIITVASPSTTLTIQDLHDTIKTIEAYIWNMSFPKLLNSFGKQDLGGSVLVGITAELQNAKVAFEARGGPSYTLCTISGGNLVAKDTAGDTMSPISPTAFTQIVLSQSSSATIIQDTAEWTQAEKDNHISTTTNIPSTTWTQAISGITGVGTIGKRIIDVLKLKRVKP